MNCDIYDLKKKIVIMIQIIFSKKNVSQIQFLVILKLVFRRSHVTYINALNQNTYDIYPLIGSDVN